MRFLGWLAGVEEGRSYAEVATKFSVGLGVVDNKVLGGEEGEEMGKKSGEESYETELAYLDRLLAEEEITKKGYEKRLGELKAKWGR